MCSQTVRDRGPVTRQRILEAAEELFAAHGPSGVTTRALAAQAGVNSAAVNYHFGGKDNLTVEVFRHVAYRTTRRRLELLDDIEDRAARAGRAPELSEIIDAFVEVYVSDEDRKTGSLLAHLVLKHRVAPNDWTRAIVRDEIDRVAERYIAALRQAAYGLSAAEVHWRYHLMVGAILIALSDDGPDSRMKRLSGGLCSPGDRTALRRELVAFLTSAFRAGGPEDTPD